MFTWARYDKPLINKGLKPLAYKSLNAIPLWINNFKKKL